MADKVKPSLFSDAGIETLRRRKVREGNEAAEAFRHLAKTVSFAVKFLAASTAAFLWELAKMPFFVLGRTLFLFFGSMAMLLKRFAP